MDVDNLLHAGSDILNAVSDAVDSNDYSHLNETIKEKVGEVKESFGGSRPDAGRASSRQSFSSSYEREMDYWKTYQNQWKARTQAQSRRPASLPNYFLAEKVSRSEGVSQMLLGVIGMVLSLGALGISIPAAVIAFGTSGAQGLAGGAVLISIFAATGFFSARKFLKGKRKNELVEEYYRYGKSLEGKEYIDLAKQAKAFHIPLAELRKKFQEMMDAGFLPSARFDSAQSTLILTGNAWRQYLEAEQSRKLREQDNSAARKKEQTAGADLSPEVRKILEDGNNYIAKVRQINDMIPDDQQMSQKLYAMEKTMRQIFAQVEKDPANAPALRRFMNYYLPTTVKLLDAYVCLEDQENVENAARSRKEIEQTVDTINDAFSALLNEMFVDTSWDISSDISVMKKMMASDGLIHEEKESREEQEAEEKHG